MRTPDTPAETGTFRIRGSKSWVLPLHRGKRQRLRVAKADTRNAGDGELVKFTRRPAKWQWARITERLGHPDQFRSLSGIALREHDIREAFPPECASIERKDHGDRTDLRHIGFLTIDPVDAHDRDDAVFAAPDNSPDNPGGHNIWIAIADVAHFVRPGSALDEEARVRGNSTYFPDFAVPMLPHALSGDACSLNPGLDRPCLAIHLRIDRRGDRISHSFFRALMRSRAALDYETAQMAIDGERTLDYEIIEVLKAIKAAFESLEISRGRRQPLDLDLEERRVWFTEGGTVSRIGIVERLVTHRIIEEFMVQANVCAAEQLASTHTPFLYRVHADPEDIRIHEFARTAQSCGFRFAKSGQVTSGRFNEVLKRAEGGEFQQLINMSALRTMQQAHYSAEPGGHFGLNLGRYTHFTSPIRRYSDLVIHRLLIDTLGLGDDGTAYAGLGSLARHLSSTERRSAAAERESLDRFAAQMLAGRIGESFAATVTAVARFGAFVRLKETGTEGLLPISRLGRGHTVFDAEKQCLTGTANGAEISPGTAVSVILSDSDPVSGSLRFEMAGSRGAARFGRGRRR
ncbi:MAG: VacB/RNase II family 3'-5' exoribonuclease [Rhodobacteraceae bacterium]|nr:VacB/RNase II family 3'-5' exoribonuclease [Paracoccaceae bacterium]